MLTGETFSTLLGEHVCDGDRGCGARWTIAGCLLRHVTRGPSRPTYCTRFPLGDSKLVGTRSFISPTGWHTSADARPQRGGSLRGQWPFEEFPIPGLMNDEGRVGSRRI